MKPLAHLARLILGAFLVTGGVTAAVPPLVNFQGKLTNSSGVPVPDGSYSIRFRIYSALTGGEGAPCGGTCLWEEVQGVSTQSGIYSVLLGSTTPLTSSAFNDPDRFLGVKVSAESEMAPRQRIASVPYSHGADVVDGLNPAESGPDILVKSRSDGKIDGSLLPSDCCGLPFSGLDVFTTSGTWTRPPGVTKVYVKVWGGGGGGTFAGTGGGGGGAGGYAEGFIAVSGNVTVTVGAGGAHQQNGANSSFAGDTTITANGGTGALPSDLVGGAGGTASGGGFNRSGNSGGTGGGGRGGDGGGNYLVATSPGDSTRARTGHFPGGGGTGSADSTGASGANGLVLVYY